MANASFQHFINKCEAGGAPVAGILTGHRYFGYVNEWEEYPNLWHAAIAATGAILRSDSHYASFARNPIPEQWLGHNPGLAQLALLGVLNASHSTVEVPEPGLALNGGWASTINNCQSAETNFSATFAAMAHPQKTMWTKSDNPIGWRIITENGRAVAVTKTINYAKSALVLVPVVDHGIPFPAGSIFSMSDGEEAVGGKKMVAPSAGITQSAFLRLSAYAFEPADRTNEYPYLSNISLGEPLRDWGIATLREIAQNAIAYSAETN